MAQPDPHAPQDLDPTLLPGSFVLADAITPQEVAAYDQALATAPDEAAMQRFLEASPRLLVQHLGGGHGRWVIPKKQLGAEYVTDFLMAEKDSTGFAWYAVELERPQAKLFTKKGDPSAALTHALRQIADWRIWLSHNRDYAMRPREQSGLGLVDIEPELDGLIIMGRQAELDPRTNPLRRRLSRQYWVKIETYDWLSQQAHARLAALEHSRGPVLNHNQRFMVSLFDGLFSGPLPEEPPLRRAVEEVFYLQDMEMPGEFQTVTWEGALFEFEAGDVIVPVQTVYANRKDTPIAPFYWSEWVNRTTNDLDSKHSLLVSEQPPDEALQAKLTEKCTGVWYLPVWRKYRWQEEPCFSRIDVFVYLSPSTEQRERIARLTAARELLLHYLPEPDHVPGERHIMR